MNGNGNSLGRRQMENADKDDRIGSSAHTVVMSSVLGQKQK